MFDSIKSLFGLEKTDYAELVKNGATILDVRTKAEYAGGHIKGSINIPVNQLVDNIQKLKGKSDKPIITCCASGMRSATAKGILEDNGFEEVYNGGSWASLQNKI